MFHERPDGRGGSSAVAAAAMLKFFTSALRVTAAPKSGVLLMYIFPAILMLFET